MISKSYLVEWSKVAPWQEDRQIEQDLIITKALLQIYGHPELRKTLAFRGGTALNKLIFNPPSRYSEDIDLVQISTEPIGQTINILRAVMDPWLGKPKKWGASGGLFTLDYRTTSDDQLPIKLKIEINTREHFAVLGFHEYQFTSSSSWSPGNAIITSYKVEELLGTKMRALYQRRKGRDLYDLYMALSTLSPIDPDTIAHCFCEYMQRAGQTVSKKQFIENMEMKLQNPEFGHDILPLISQRFHSFDPVTAYELVRTKLIEKL